MPPRLAYSKSLLGQDWAERKGSSDFPAFFDSQMKTLDSDNARLGRELADLQGRMALGERAEKESRREVLRLRQKLLKGESSLEALKQEVTGQQLGWPEEGGLLSACLPSRGEC